MKKFILSAGLFLLAAVEGQRVDGRHRTKFDIVS